MADHLSPQGRSRNMAGIRSKDTKPELVMRALLRASGATGYRLHRKDLPGRPDIAFIRWKVAVFVDGAFWHGHPNHIRSDASPYWVEKIHGNRARDEAVDAALSALGWTVVRVWDTTLQEDPILQRDRVLLALRQAGWLDREVEGQV